jgi:hypothetical protein
MSIPMEALSSRVPLPPVIPIQAQAVPIQVPLLQDPVAPKQFILCISKDLTKDDLDLFKNINIEVYDDSIHRNVQISSYPFDVLVLDMRQKGDRYTYMKEVQAHRELYNVIVYCHGFEKEEGYVDDADNIISKLPEKQANKQDFLSLLLLKRVKKPRWYVSLFKCCFQAYKSAKN